MKWTPDILIAFNLVIGSMILLIMGIDGEVKTILIMAAGWTFGSGYVRKGNNNKGGSK